MLVVVSHYTNMEVTVEEHRGCVEVEIGLETGGTTRFPPLSFQVVSNLTHTGI